MPSLVQGDTPTYGDPTNSWPTYSLVGKLGGSGATQYPDVLQDRQFSLRREDDEIILILSAILKEL